MAIEIVQTIALMPPVQEYLERDYTVHKLWEAKDRDAFLKQIAPNVRAIVTAASIGADRALMQALPKVEVISSRGVGYDPIDIGAAKELGIVVANTPDVLTDCVADTALSLLLAIMRRIPHADQFVREGQWPNGRFPLTDKIGGKRMGVVGFGRIGQAIAKRAAGFDVEISYFGPRKKTDSQYRYYDDLVAMAKDSDILMIACPGGKETRGIVNQAVIDALGSKGYIVNIARGSVVDEPAMITALASGKLAGAGLDVVANEPNPSPDLLKLKNIVLAPHVGSRTHETQQAMGEMVMKNLAGHFSGKGVIARVV